MRTLALAGALVGILGALPSSMASPADQMVFQHPLNGQNRPHVGTEWEITMPPHTPPPTKPRARKVAIIGAGAGGSSAAYFLSKAQERLDRLGMVAPDLEVTLFERDERIGGRTAVVHPYNDTSLPAIELGASIFADVNKNLQRAVKQFNLTTGARLGEEGITGVWDGQQFLVEGLDNGWWNSAKMFWRYGYSPVTAQKLVGKTVDAFLRLYDPSYLHRPSEKKATLIGQKEDGTSYTESGYPWGSIEAINKAMNFEQMVARTGGDHFYSQGVSKLFVEEIIEAATLVNYGQEVFSIHGLGGSVSLAASGATGVVGGNYQIFERMLGQCNALRMRLGIHGEVTGLARFRTIEDAVDAGKISAEEAAAQGFLADEPASLDSRRSTKWWLGTKSGYGGMFDAVFIATPWHDSGITLLNTPAVVSTPKYVHLHVTLVVTKADKPNPAYFGRGEGDAVPNSVLTSHISVRKENEDERKRKEKEGRRRRGDDEDDGKDGAQIRGRWSSRLWPWGGGGGEKRGPHLDFNALSYLTPIPSRTEEGKEDHVVKIFSPELLDDDKLNAIFGDGNVVWTYRKEWDAYPYLTPRTTFPKVRVDDNLFFLNAMESFISTMETATVSARNAVALYLVDQYGAPFVHGGDQCPWQKADAAKVKEAEVGEDDWAAWGCRGA